MNLLRWVSWRILQWNHFFSHQLAHVWSTVCVSLHIHDACVQINLLRWVRYDFMTHSAPKSELTHFNKDITHLSKCMQTRASTRERVMLVHTRVDFGFWIALDRRMNSNYARKSWLSCLKKSQNGLISTHSWICWDESDTSMKSHGSIEMNHEKDMNVLKWIMTWLISKKSWMCWDVMNVLRWVSSDFFEMSQSWLTSIVRIHPSVYLRCECNPKSS